MADVRNDCVSMAARELKRSTRKFNFCKEKIERCVICGRITNIPTTMPIDLRENYVSGCGQLCNNCLQKLKK